MTGRPSSWTLALALLLCCGGARAEFDFKPAVSLRAIYDDNIYLAEKDRQDDFITHLIPGFVMREKNGLFTFDADYSLDFRYYSKRKSLNDNRPEDVQLARLSLFTEPLWGFSLDLRETYDRSVVDDRRPSAERNDLLNKVSRNLFTAQPKWTLELESRYQFVVSYLYESEQFKDTTSDDRVKQSGKAELKKVLPSLGRSLGLWGETGRVDNSVSKDYSFSQARVFIEQEPGTPGFAYHLDAGVKALDPAEGTGRNSVVAALKVARPIGSNIMLGLTGGRDFSQGTIDGAYKSWKAGTAFTWMRTLITTLKYDYKFDEYLFQNRRDESNAVGLDMSIRLGDNFSVTAGGAYTHRELDPMNTRDDILNFTSGIKWEVEHLNASLGYNYTDSRSNLPDNRFEVNTVIFQIGFSL